MGNKDKERLGRDLEFKIKGMDGEVFYGSFSSEGRRSGKGRNKDGSVGGGVQEKLYSLGGWSDGVRFLCTIPKFQSTIILHLSLYVWKYRSKCKQIDRIFTGKVSIVTFFLCIYI